ncbi:NtrC family transcriptional regulator, ATPase domain [Geomicrobium sp. JCM 19039]|nr:NtrC family transcriptional regulator, ATPase domain [Geomicrobium sp. JCM 19039]
MVLEAGRKSLVEGITAHQVYEAAYDAMTVFMRHETAPSLPKKKRVIATVCFTGEGAAQLLEEWIASQLTTADDDVVIRTVRVDPVTRDTSLLYQLKDYYEMIAIIGTVSISMDEVPFIPAWELLKEEGSSRLFKLLEMTRKYDSSHTEPENVLSEDSMCIIEPGLNEIVSHLDAALFCKLLDEHIPGLRKYYDWEFDRSLGMSMHIGVFIDRMLDAQMNNEEKKLISTIPAYPDLKVLPEEYKLWFPFLKQIEVSFHIFIPDEFLRGSVKLAR